MFLCISELAARLGIARPSDEIAARSEAEILLPGADEVPRVRRVDRDRRLDLIPSNVCVVKRGSRAAARKRARA